MKTLRFAILSILLAATAFAQSASLQANGTKLAAAGGTVQLTATVSYDGEPGAIGWSITLPAEWKLAGISGPNVPTVVPEVGSTGTLEFAFSAIPAGRAEFSISVTYPAGAALAKAVPTVLVRKDGKLATLTPAPVEFSAK